MPVVFEQPDPAGFLSGPAQAGGYVAQYNADRQFALQAAALQAHAAQANAGLQLQRQLGTAQIQQQGQALAERGMVSPADQFAARERMAMQGNQFAQQQALQSQRFQQQQAMGQQAFQESPSMFTQGDSIQLQKLQAGLSDIARRRGSGDLSDQDADALTQQVQPQIAALQRKQQMTRRAVRGQQTTEGIQDAAAAAATQNASDAQIAKASGAPDGSNRVPIDPSDSSKGIAGVVIGGKFHAFNAGAIKAATGEAGAKGGKETEGFDAATIGHVAKTLETEEMDEAGKIHKKQGSPQQIADALQTLAAAKKKAHFDNMAPEQREDEIAKYTKRYPTKPLIDPATGQQQIDPATKQPMVTNDAPPAVKDLIIAHRKALGLNADGSKPTPAAPPGATVTTRTTPVEKTEVKTGAPNVSQSDVPAGYRKDDKLPGYVLPERWQEGVHYRVTQNEKGENVPEELIGPYTPGRIPGRFIEGLKSLPGEPARLAELGKKYIK